MMITFIDGGFKSNNRFKFIINEAKGYHNLPKVLSAAFREFPGITSKVKLIRVHFSSTIPRVHYQMIKFLCLKQCNRIHERFLS